MKNYIIMRLLATVPLLLGISFLCFVFINLIPSDPAHPPDPHHYGRTHRPDPC